MAKIKLFRELPTAEAAQVAALKLTAVSALLLIFLYLLTVSQAQMQYSYDLGDKIGAKLAHAQEVTSASGKPLFDKLPTPTPVPQLNSIPIQSGNSVNVPILTYHYVGINPDPSDIARYDLAVTPDNLDKQFGHLASKGYTPVTLNELHAAIKGQGTLPAKPVILTFDDGYIDFYTDAFPIIKKHNFRVTSFLPTGLLDNSYYLRWNQIKEIDQSGLVSFEAHSINHPNMTTLTYEEAKNQALTSKAAIENQLSKKVNFFCYPYGSSNATSWQAVKDAGYLGAVGTWYGTQESEGVMFNMPRVKISGHLPLEKFISMFP